MSLNAFLLLDLGSAKGPGTNVKRGFVLNIRIAKTAGSIEIVRDNQDGF